MEIYDPTKIGFDFISIEAINVFTKGIKARICSLKETLKTIPC